MFSDPPSVLISKSQPWSSLSCWKVLPPIYLHCPTLFQPISPICNQYIDSCLALQPVYISPMPLGPHFPCPSSSPHLPSGPYQIPHTLACSIMGSSFGLRTLVSFWPRERMGVGNTLFVPSPTFPVFLYMSDSHMSDHHDSTGLVSSPLPHLTAHPSF